MDLIDGLSVTRHVSSSVNLSKGSLFRRKFSITYDLLTAQLWIPEQVKRLLGDARL